MKESIELLENVIKVCAWCYPQCGGTPEWVRALETPGRPISHGICEHHAALELARFAELLKKDPRPFEAREICDKPGELRARVNPNIGQSAG